MDERNVQLRSEDGDVIEATELLELVPNRTGLLLHHFLMSIEVETPDEDE